MRAQFFDTQGNVLNGGKLFFYAAGSSTKQTTYNSSLGTVANSNPMILDAFGRLQSEVWLTTGLFYKEILTTSTDTDPPVSPIWSEDNIAGINDATISINEWITGPTPTFVSTTSFTLAGDQTTLFSKGARLKFTVSAGTVYGSILTSVFGALTTVTLEMDSGQVLDVGLSAVSYSLLNSVHPSMPPYLETMPIAVDHTDQTKRIKLIATGITTGTTRSLTAQDANGSVALTSEFAYLGLPSTSGRLLLPNDYISGFALTNNGATGFDVAAGQAMDSTNVSNIIGAAIANKTQGAWVVGAGNGGKLSAAAMANNTWYYWYALWKTVDGTVDYGFDVATTPTLPSGYSKFHYIGARKTQSASTNWDTFIQHGDEVLWSTPPALDVNTNNPGTAAITATLNVPALKVKAIFRYVLVDTDAAGSSDAAVSFTSLEIADISPNVSGTPLADGNVASTAATGVGAWVHPGIWTNTSSQIRYRMSLSNANITIRVVIIGWIDPRGKPV